MYDSFEPVPYIASSVMYGVLCNCHGYFFFAYVLVIVVLCKCTELTLLQILHLSAGPDTSHVVVRSSIDNCCTFRIPFPILVVFGSPFQTDYMS